MKEGYWIQPATGKTWEVAEHCSFAKSEAGANAMGLPDKVRQEIASKTCDFNGPDREAVVIAVMKAGYMRMRGHGSQYSFEFWGNTVDNLWAVLAFCERNAGPFTWLVVNNLKTNEQFASQYKDFEERMKRDTDEVLRTAAQLLKNPALLGSSGS